MEENTNKLHFQCTDFNSCTRVTERFDITHFTLGMLLHYPREIKTLVHPTQGLTLSAKFLHRCASWPSSDLRAKFYGDRPRGAPTSGALNARGVSKFSDFRPIEGYVS